jgi:flagellar basal body rod protein FlgF
VQDKAGNEVYTRNGNIQQDDQGQLTIDGNIVLGDNGPIILPPNAIALSVATARSPSHLTMAMSLPRWISIA